MHVGRLAHVALGVGDDRDSMLRFYRELFGLTAVDGAQGTLFLSGGKKPGYDIALVPGEPGMHHVAFEVASLEDLREAGDRLADAGVTASEIDVANDHGVLAGLGFALPAGHALELIVLEQPAVFRGTPTVGPEHFVGAGPVDLEHCSIDCNDVEGTARFLMETLDFFNTEYSQPAGGPWFLAFLRTNELHHDLGVFRHDAWEGPGFNHVGFAVPSIVEIARVADLACAQGWKLQCSPGRHLVGDNIFIYLTDPSGNRVEVGTPMTKIERSAPTRGFDASGDTEWGGFDGWREGIPPLARTPGRCVPAATANAS
jgi:catechol 2,3-dioxygenase